MKLKFKTDLLCSACSSADCTTVLYCTRVQNRFSAKYPPPVCPGDLSEEPGPPPHLPVGGLVLEEVDELEWYVVIWNEVILLPGDHEVILLSGDHGALAAAPPVVCRRIEGIIAA